MIGELHCVCRGHVWIQRPHDGWQHQRAPYPLLGLGGSSNCGNIDWNGGKDRKNVPKLSHLVAWILEFSFMVYVIEDFCSRDLVVSKTNVMFGKRVYQCIFGIFIFDFCSISVCLVDFYTLKILFSHDITWVRIKSCLITHSILSNCHPSNCRFYFIYKQIFLFRNPEKHF